MGECDVLFRSPGVRLDTPEIQAAAAAGTVVTSQVKFFLQNCSSMVVGVTGTKGKGTTSSLIHAMLQASGKTSHLAGNFGVGVLPLLDVLAPEDYVVLELSSFQLMDVDRSPHVAVVLMVTSAHLDYHETGEAYVSAKENITKFQSSKDFSVVNVDFPSSVKIGSLGHAQRYYVQTVDREQAASGASFAVYQPENFLKIKEGVYAEQVNGGIYNVENGTSVRIAAVGDFQLRGFHNVQNIAAALAVSDVLELDLQKSLAAAKAFRGLPHRLELVGEAGGVQFYNDSIGTTPDSALAAVRAFAEPVVAIVGGHDSGSSYVDMANHLSRQKNLKAVVLIGELAPAIQQELEGHGLPKTVHVATGAASMDEAVEQAANFASSGDVVVLAPGARALACSSTTETAASSFELLWQGGALKWYPL